MNGLSKFDITGNNDGIPMVALNYTEHLIHAVRD